MERTERTRQRLLPRHGPANPGGDRSEKRKPSSFPVTEVSKFEKMSRQDVVWAIMHVHTLLQTFLEGAHRAKAPREGIMEMELGLENLRMVQKWIRDTQSPDQVHRVVTPDKIHNQEFTSLEEAQDFTRAPYRKGQ